MTTTIRTSGASRPTPTRSPTASADRFVLTLWTDEALLAGRADAAGVDRIGVDLERLGKAERQRGLATWISPHTVEDLRAVGAALRRAALFARVNPLHAGSEEEIEAVLAAGARAVMLPMVASASEARAFARLVGGRATAILLVESAAAVRAIDALAAVEGVDEVHLGLNDLALSLGLRNRWMTLAGDVALRVGRAVTGAGLRFGLGGLGRPGDATLPIPADLVYAEYGRTGATAALLSRSFMADGPGDLAADIVATRARLAHWSRATDGARASAHAELGRRARAATGW